MEIRKNEKGIHIQLTSSEFDRVFPGYWREKKWLPMTEEEICEMCIPYKDDAEVTLCIIHPPPRRNSWVWGTKKDAIQALTNAGYYHTVAFVKGENHLHWHSKEYLIQEHAALVLEKIKLLTIIEQLAQEKDRLECLVERMEENAKNMAHR